MALLTASSILPLLRERYAASNADTERSTSTALGDCESCVYAVSVATAICAKKPWNKRSKRGYPLLRACRSHPFAACQLAHC